MTRKKAIEAAIAASTIDRRGRKLVGAEGVAARAYDAGFVAGMRDAARLISTRCTGCHVEITQRANALAKKARKP